MQPTQISCRKMLFRLPRYGITLGANYLGGGRCAFRVWAPRARRVEVHLLGPLERLAKLRRTQNGYHRAVVNGVQPGCRYFYQLDNQRELPDPASRYQPEGVHGPSEVVDPRFHWGNQDWSGLSLRDYIIYELHVGTFTRVGTFDAAVSRLRELKQLGITAIELMPIAQFPGGRNWGYDGVFPFAVQNSYGGPDALKRLVNACHRFGLAVVLDVVYNHLGPEGNYLGEFAPFFSDRYRTPWGPAPNVDGPDSDEVRRYFIENALYWQTEFHIDALRLDAVHAVQDFSATPFWEELATVTHQQAERLKRRFHLIAESDSNDARFISARERGGYGLDAQWSDDFHHALHVLLTGDRVGYYEDYGGVKQLAKVFREGFAYTGEYSKRRRHRHGNSPRWAGVRQFVVFAQNHDQVGNRPRGERLGHLVPFESQKLAAAAVLLSPFTPFLFMGEEYGETAPFYFFIDHSDAKLIEAVRRGRRQELAAFNSSDDPPDPQDPATFKLCQLNPNLARKGSHRTLREFYRELIRLRRQLPALRDAEKHTVQVRAYERKNVLIVRSDSPTSEIALILCFGCAQVTLRVALSCGRWRTVMNSTLKRWKGKNSPIGRGMVSNGEVALKLPAKSALLVVHAKERAQCRDFVLDLGSNNLVFSRLK